MSNPYVWFWAAMVFASLAWYSYLLFHVGWKGGWDIVELARELSRRAAEDENDEP